MQSHTRSQGVFYKAVCSKPVFFLYNSHELYTSNGMFYPHPHLYGNIAAARV